jgi:hypothetical protein
MVGKNVGTDRQVIISVAVHGVVGSNKERGSSRVCVRQRGVQCSERERATDGIHAIKTGASIGTSRWKGGRIRRGCKRCGESSCSETHDEEAKTANDSKKEGG